MGWCYDEVLYYLLLGAEDSLLHCVVGGGLRGAYRAGDYHPLLGHLVVPALVEGAVGSEVAGQAGSNRHHHRLNPHQRFCQIVGHRNWRQPV